VVAAKPEAEIWPVGWPPERPAREVLPALFEWLNVNIEDTAVARVAEAIGKRMEVPILFDHNALARFGIDREEVKVSLPRARTYYARALERALFQARLKSELRVDEAGKPLIWITTLKPASY
jgi:hypothetical protein